VREWNFDTLRVFQAAHDPGQWPDIPDPAGFEIQLIITPPGFSGNSNARHNFPRESMPVDTSENTNI